MCEDSSATTVRHLQRCVLKRGFQPQATGLRRSHPHPQRKPGKATGRVERVWSGPTTPLFDPREGAPEPQVEDRSALVGAEHPTRCVSRAAEQRGLQLGPQ